MEEVPKSTSKKPRITVGCVGSTQHGKTTPSLAIFNYLKKGKEEEIGLFDYSSGKEPGTQNINTPGVKYES